jgi:hypothetical protein
MVEAFAPDLDADELRIWQGDPVVIYSRVTE